MKTVKSYSLSLEAIKKVEETKKKGNFRSDSEALESIILNKKNDVEEIRKIVLDILKENQLAVTEHKTNEKLPQDIVDEVESKLINSMEDIFKNIK